MHAFRWIVAASLLAGAAWSPSAVQAQAKTAEKGRAKIDIELVSDAGFPAAETRAWYRLFTELKVDNLRIASDSAGEEPGIETTGKAPNVAYKVHGRLTADNRLVLPGGVYSPRDRGRIKTWLDRLRKDGPPKANGEGAGPAPFGLSADRLQAVRRDLAHTLDFSTKDLPLGEALTKTAKLLNRPLAIEPEVEITIAQADKIGEELQGLAAGAALSYLVRPLGLAMAPRPNAKGEVEYAVSLPDGNREVWPIGWKPAKRPTELVPAFYELSSVNIDDFPLDDVVQAIGGRIGAAVLYDRYSLELHGVDLHKTKVTVRSPRMSDQSALRQALGKARLKFELRVDEADRPLLWISSAKPARKAARSEE